MLRKRENISIVVDKNPQLGYEKVNLFYYLFILPAALILAFWVALKKLIFGKNLKINTFWFDGSSSLCRKIKENATRWRALDIIYNYTPGKNKSFEGKVTDFWNNLLAIKATRNRLRLLKFLLKQEIQNLLKKFNEINLISVASGSAQGVIEVMKELKDQPIKAVFLDLDGTALEHSKKLAKAAGIIDKIIFSQKSARDLEEIAESFRPHLIEVVGFLMYRPLPNAINLIKRVYKILIPEGILIVSQDNHVIEKPFHFYVANWPIIYRSPEEFSKIIIEGGFDPKYCQIIYEPLKMHGLAVCQKII